MAMNAETSVNEDNILTIKVDLNAETQVSNSGKTDLVSKHNTKIPGTNWRLNMNIFTKRE